MKRSKLYLYTFGGIVLSMLVVGVFAVPLVLQQVRQAYISVQTDVNKRQAEGMAKVLGNLVAGGASVESVIETLQISVQGSEVDRGYLCMLQGADGKLLCHPDPKMVGREIGPMGMTFSPAGTPESTMIPWLTAIMGPATGGVIHYPDGRAEINYLTPVPGTKWVLSSHENTGRVEGEILTLQTLAGSGFALLGLLVAFPASFAARRVSRRYELRILDEQRRSDDLLLNILPAPVARRLKDDEGLIADSHELVHVLFADIVGFTHMTKGVEPAKVLKLLNFLFSRFDALADLYRLEKIKTIGDAYMVAGGLNTTSDLRQLAQMALDMLTVLKTEFQDKGRNIQIRIGLHSGPAVAGVIGTSKFAYDLWGETVNTASRLESLGEPGRIQVSQVVRDALQDDFAFEERGEVTLKGVGKFHTWFLTGHTEVSHG
jgi:class 3 adenylate cyclase